MDHRSTNSLFRVKGPTRGLTLDSVNSCDHRSAAAGAKYLRLASRALEGHRRGKEKAKRCAQGTLVGGVVGLLNMRVVTSKT